LITLIFVFEDKIDIVQNAIDLTHAIGVDEVRVAILSAFETVNPKINSTLEAAALCKMADRGQIKGGILDGPLALDNAISVEAAQIKGCKDVLVVTMEPLPAWRRLTERAVTSPQLPGYSHHLAGYGV
jgi:phosphate acetyltransferase